MKINTTSITFENWIGYYVVYINNQYIKNGPIDPEGLFIKEEITEAVESLVGSIERQIERMVDIIKHKNAKLSPNRVTPLLQPLVIKTVISLVDMQTKRISCQIHII